MPRVKETSRVLLAFAAVVRSLREMRRLGLEDVSRRTSISVANLRKIEDGFYDPLLNEVFELSSALHVSPGEFVRLVEGALAEPQP
jgi:transcriptional regulator with XRE-family HTH domain